MRDTLYHPKRHTHTHGGKLSPSQENSCLCESTSGTIVVHSLRLEVVGLVAVQVQRVRENNGFVCGHVFSPRQIKVSSFHFPSRDLVRVYVTCLDVQNMRCYCAVHVELHL